MKALSQSEYGELRNLYESIYTPKVDLTEELLDEIFDELVDEYIEEGYSEEDAIEIVDEAVDLYIDEVLCEVSDSYYDSAVRASKKAAQGIDKAARQKRRAGQVRYAKRKAGEALKTAGDKVKGAFAGAQIAGSIAKDEAKRAGRKAKHSITSAPGKAKASVDRKKKGIKGFIKRQAQKVVDRMSEELEAIGEDSRRMSNKQHTKRVRSNIKSFGSNYTPPSNYDPDANRGQGEVLTRKQIEKNRRKALRQEELELDQMVESLIERGHTEQEAYALVAQFTLDDESQQLDEAEKPFPHEKVKAKQVALRDKGGNALDRRMKMGMAVRRAKEAEKTGGSQRDAGKGWYHAKEDYVNEAQEARNNPEKYEREQSKKYAPVRGEKTPMPPRGDKRREDFEKWYAKQMSEGYDEPKMHSAVKRVMTTQPAAKGRAASRLHSKYSMRSKGNVAGETDGPGPNAPKRSGRKGRGSETDRGSGNAAKRRMEG